MTEPSPIQIPLLIQEKLNFYIWYHRLRSVHKEYFSLFIVRKGLLGWSYLTYIVNTDTIICMLECNIEFRYNQIYKFRTSGIHRSIRAPSKFYFSSGLNHKEGYKLSAEQLFLKKLF
jgi:hypothetical protein